MANLTPTRNVGVLRNYKYPALKDRSIRVMNILPGKFSDPIRCFLKEIHLDSELSYEALSYCWGEPIFNKTLIVLEPTSPLSAHDWNKEYTLKITPSLHDALLYVRSEEEEVCLWADAVCINQSDVKERSSQVGSMSEIYNHATRVRIWLGLADEHSEIAFDWLDKCYNSAVQVWPGYLRPSIDGDWPDVEPKLSEIPAELRCRDCMVAAAKTLNFKTPADEWFNKLGDEWYGGRKWWSRRWVLQEIKFARGAVLMCGRQSVDWNQLEVLASVTGKITETELKGRLSDQLELKDIVVPWGLTFRGSTLLSSLRHSHSRSSVGTKDLTHTLTSFSNYQVTDPRDNLYAILSICDDGKHRIVPDYSKPLIKVYIDVTKALLSEWSSLVPLSFQLPAQFPGSPSLVKSTGSIPPSWVVDIENWDQHFSNSPFLFRADKSCTNVRIEITKCYVHDVLKVRGLYCDKIDRLDMSTDSDFDDKENFLRTLSFFAELFRSSGLETHNLLRLLFWDCEPPAPHLLGGRLSPESLAALLSSSSLRSVVGQGLLHVEDEMFRRDGFPGNPLWTISNLMPLVAYYYNSAFRKSGWRLCRFTSGRLGWAPLLAQAGDLVYIVMGSPVPFIFRPVDEQSGEEHHRYELHARLRGFAYIHGVMDGELMAEDNIKRMEEICIH